MALINVGVFDEDDAEATFLGYLDDFGPKVGDVGLPIPGGTVVGFLGIRLTRAAAEAARDRKAARQESRQDRKAARQESRQDRKATRQENRQERRADRQEARQDRKYLRVESRQGRDNLRVADRRKVAPGLATATLRPRAQVEDPVLASFPLAPAYAPSLTPSTWDSDVWDEVDPNTYWMSSAPAPDLSEFWSYYDDISDDGELEREYGW